MTAIINKVHCNKKKCHLIRYSSNQWAMLKISKEGSELFYMQAVSVELRFGVYTENELSMKLIIWDESETEFYRSISTYSVALSPYSTSVLTIQIHNNSKIWKQTFLKMEMVQNIKEHFLFRALNSIRNTHCIL